MKRSIFLVWIVVAFLTVTMTTCKEDKVAVTGVTLDKEAYTLDAGADFTLIATIEPDNAGNKDVKWATMNPVIADVNANGKVIAKTVGTATITVITMDGGFKQLCVVTVTPAFVPVTGISVQPEIELGITEERWLTYVIAPANATNRAVTASSDDPAVADVLETDAENGRIRLKGYKSGTANISITTDDGSYTSQCAVLIRKVSFNLLSNPGFEEPAEVQAPFTTGLQDWIQIDWDWATQYYEMDNEMSGPKGLGVGNATAVTNSIRANRLDGTYPGAANARYFIDLGGLRDNCAARIANAGGNLLGGFYQIVTVEPGETYSFGAIVGQRPNGDPQNLRDFEILKLLSPDGFTVYRTVLIDPTKPQEGDVYVLSNNRMASIRYINETYTVPDDGSVTQIRFQFDARAINGTDSQLPIIQFDDCFFQLVVE